MWSIAGVWAHFMCTYHVIGELSAEVVAASAPDRADHIHDHLFELVRPGPQVIEGSPAGCLDLCICAGVGATCSQVFHCFNSFRGVKWTIQLWKSQRKWFQKVLFYFLRGYESIANLRVLLLAFSLKTEQQLTFQNAVPLTIDIKYTLTLIKAMSLS